MSRYRLFSPLALLFAMACASAVSITLGAHATDAPAAPPATPPASGVYYEIFVRAWYDTNGDGIGDLNGVTAKLDYLKSLGISGIWLMPINPSPSYHGYDITDYYGINPQYGSMQDFQHLLDEAHKRGIAVTMDMVINHTSQQHPWFLAARDPADPHHDWFTWAGAHPDLNAQSAPGGRIWHKLGDTYYLGDFGGGMPDLNYDNPAVRAEMVKVGQFWLAKGVDGFRLDAAKHIYDDFKSREHDPEIVTKNVAWWTQFHDAIATVNPRATLVGEVMAKSPDELAPYLKPLGSVFDFPLAEQLIVSAKSERVGKLDQLLEDTYAAYRGAGDVHGGTSAPSAGRAGGADVPFIDSTFLSNHDQERVMSRLDGDGQRMRMAAAMLLTLPGRPYLYYGEELGMEGRKPDENLREPMRWQRGAAPGDSRWKPTSVNQGEAVSVQAEQDDPASMLNFYRMLISWRSQVGALRDGDLQMQATGNPRVLAYWRQDGAQRVLVVHNLSGQAVTWEPASPVLPKDASVLLKSKPDVALVGGSLKLPAYSSVVLR